MSPAVHTEAGSRPCVQTSSSQGTWERCPYLPIMLRGQDSVNDRPFLLDLSVGLPDVHQQLADRFLQAFWGEEPRMQPLHRIGANRGPALSTGQPRPWTDLRTRRGRNTGERVNGTTRSARVPHRTGAGREHAQQQGRVLGAGWGAPGGRPSSLLTAEGLLLPLPQG